MRKRIFTIGHSNRSFEDFLRILKSYGIELIADVRRFPSSRKFPHFNKEALENELSKYGIPYFHIPELGGYREQGYKAFSETEEFERGIEKLIRISEDKTVAIMCAELLFWKCHRRFIADKLCERSYEVLHIFDEKRAARHKRKAYSKSQSRL